MIVAWPLAILVALLGWSFAAAWAAKRIGGVHLHGVGETFAAGLAMLLAVAGVLVALGAFTSLAVTIWLAAGIACAVLALAPRALRSHRLLTRRHVVDVAVGLTLIAAVFLVALWGTAHHNWNSCGDDDTAYLYLARRLVLRGDLLDPLNFRRLSSLGGMTALQAVFLMRLPDSFLPFADLFLGPLLILFALWRSQARRWAPWAVAATGLVMLFPANLGLFNASPILIPVGLSLAAWSVALQLRAQSSTPRARLVLGCIIGLLVGAAVTLRPQFGLPLGVVPLLMTMWPPLGFATLQRLAGLSIGLVAVLGGWAAASWRAVGTPLFPLVPGNLDTAWPANGPAGGPPSVTAFIGRLAGSLVNPPWAIALLGSIAVVAVVLTRPQVQGLYRHWGLRLQVVAAVASVALLAGLLLLLWGLGSPYVYSRYWAPLLMAVVLMPFLLINRIGGQLSRVATLAACATFGLVILALTADPIRGGQRVFDVVHDTVTGQVTDLLLGDRYASVRTEYVQAAAQIPAGAKVLAAVDVPSLLIKPASELNTLDTAGSTSPSPHLPYFQGTQAKLAWLRSQGFTYIVAVDPGASFCLYNADHQTQERQGKYGRALQVWAPYYLDWFDFVRDVSNPAIAHSSRVGSLIVVRL